MCDFSCFNCILNRSVGLCKAGEIFDGVTLPADWGEGLMTKLNDKGEKTVVASAGNLILYFAHFLVHYKLKSGPRKGVAAYTEKSLNTHLDSLANLNNTQAILYPQWFPIKFEIVL